MNSDGRAVTFLFGELDTLCSSLCRHDPQESGVGIPRRRDPRDDPALRDAAAQLDLHRRYPGQEARRAGWSEEGRGNRGKECLRPSALVEAG